MIIVFVSSSRLTIYSILDNLGDQLTCVGARKECQPGLRDILETASDDGLVLSTDLDLAVFVSLSEVCVVSVHVQILCT